MDNESGINQLNLVSVAYIGDAVYSLFIRERLIKRHSFKSGQLHLLSNNYVKAESQSKVLESITERLSAEELDVIRRARNMHTPCKAKNAALSDYRRATALEGLIGYLYLCGRGERLSELLNFCAECVESGFNLSKKT